MIETMPRLALVASVLIPAVVPAQTASDCHDVPELQRRLQVMVRTVARQGAGLLLVHENHEIARLYEGGIQASTVVPIASSTKWLSGAVIMKLVDQGKLSLDDPIRKFRTDFTGAAAGITIRQLFSHTAGLVRDDPLIRDRNVTLEQAVAGIAQKPLDHVPGSAFTYGGSSMHVAGRIAEQVGGNNFEQLFKDLIGTPIGMRNIDFQAFGPTSNFMIAGGAQCTLDDYGRFLEMLAGNGIFRGRRILSAASVDAMLADQTRGARIVYTPQRDNRRYGIGCWRDRLAPNGDALENSSPGAFGAWPFVDRERNSYGMLLVRSLGVLTRNQATALLNEVRQQVRYAGLRCYGHSTPACRGTVRMAGNRPALAGDASFALTGFGAPSDTAGAILFGSAAVARPVRLAGIDLWLAPGQVVASAPVRSDASGNLSLPLPLTGLTPGRPVFAQIAWANKPLCGGRGTLSSSHALAITLR